MKKLLVPVDFSTYAERALHYAAELASKAGGEIILLHIHQQKDVHAAKHGDHVNQEALSLNDLTERVNKRGVQVTSILRDGNITENIIQAAKENNVDAIVMGTLGATGIKTAIFGTKAANVIQNSTVPVITVPFDYEWKQPTNILLAVNEADEDTKLFEPVLAFASLFNAQIRTVVFSTAKAMAVDLIESDRTVSRMQQLLKEHYTNQSIETVHLSGKDFHQTLQEYIEANNIDLIVMITHKRTFIQSLFKFSMTKEMAYHATVPLLSLHSTHA